jgi:hypothetical protein
MIRARIVTYCGLLGLGACGPLGGTVDGASAGSAGNGGAAGEGGSMGSAGARPANPHGRQSLVWVWQSYRNALTQVLANANSFTHVSPALYQMNYDYQSGVVHSVNPGGSYEGFTGSSMAAALHSAGIKIVPLMYAGAGNHGTDQGIQNILNDPVVAQSFIDAQVREAIDNGYDGWNLDWEVQTTTYPGYGQKLITFLAAFKAALHAQQMELSFDLGGWYVKQCTSSGGEGLVDLKAFAPAVDRAIIENYAGSLEGPTDKCPASVPDLQSCDSFGDGLSVMCGTASETVAVGLITPGSNPFAPQALAAIASYGFKNVAIWPDDSAFLNPRALPDSGTWYGLLGAWLAQ